MTAPFGRRSARIEEVRRVGPYVAFTVADPDGPRPRAGQFFMLSLPTWGGDDGRPFLPRAFSVARCGEGTLEFVLEDIGPGTRLLAGVQPGEEILLTGPLGRPFEAPVAGRGALLVGGGVGIAPMMILQDELLAAEAPHVTLLGFRDARYAEASGLFTNPRVASDDGSAGRHGFVTDLLLEELDADPRAVVFACGPPGMLEAVRQMAAERGAEAQLALESGMACGFGACFGCVVALRGGGYARVCVDGPVLDAAALLEVPAH